MSRTLVLTPPSMARTDRDNPGDCNVQSVVGKSSTSLARAVVVHSSSDSESKPADGLSRGRSEGPWQRAVRARMPTDLEEPLQAECSSRSDLD